MIFQKVRSTIVQFEQQMDANNNQVLSTWWAILNLLEARERRFLRIWIRIKQYQDSRSQLLRLVPMNIVQAKEVEMGRGL